VKERNGKRARRSTDGLADVVGHRTAHIAEDQNLKNVNRETDTQIKHPKGLIADDTPKKKREKGNIRLRAAGTRC
jgi:hypothetical protein